MTFAEAFVEYQRLHRDAPLIHDALRKPFDENSAKYLVVRALPEAGIGNRLLTMAAALILAMLTSRILLVRFPDAQIERLLQEPFASSSWLLPYETMTFLHDSASYASENHVPRLLKLNLFADTDETNLRLLLCRSETLEAAQVVMPMSYQYFVPLLFYHPTYRETLLQWFPDRDIFTPVARFLFHPNQLILEAVLANLNRMGEGPKVGVQFRNFDGQFNEAMILQAQKSLQSLNVKNATLYVSSLRPEYSLYLRRQGYTAIQQHAAGKQEYSTEHLIEAMIDIWTLSAMDHRIVTGVSTFGYVATGLAGNPSYFMGETTQQKSHEPCQHFRKPYLRADLCSDREMAFLSDEMSVCEDGKLGFLLQVKY